MKPAPPVIIIFLTSGKGSNFVLPVRTGASFQTPKSSKNLFAPFVAPEKTRFTVNHLLYPGRLIAIALSMLHYTTRHDVQAAGRRRTRRTRRSALTRGAVGWIVSHGVLCCAVLCDAVCCAVLVLCRVLTKI